MEILDKDLREYFRGLSDEDLEERFARHNFALNKFGINSFSTSLNALIDSKYLKKISGMLQTQNAEFKGFDEHRANPTEEELELEELFDIELSRKTTEGEISVLAEQVLMLRKGEKFTKLSIKDMEKKIEDVRKKALKNASTTTNEIEQFKKEQEVLFAKDRTYGIDINDMTYILECMKSREFITELVSKIPVQELKEKKERFEKFRNSPIFHYESREKDMHKTLAETFGDIEYPDGIGFYIENKFPMVEISDAFDERLKELENKKENKKENKEENSKGLFGRFKDWLNRRKQKQLPEGRQEQQPEDIKNDSKKDKKFKESLYVSEEEMSKRRENREKALDEQYRDDQGQNR